MTHSLFQCALSGQKGTARMKGQVSEHSPFLKISVLDLSGGWNFNSPKGLCRIFPSWKRHFSRRELLIVSHPYGVGGRRL